MDPKEPGIFVKKEDVYTKEELEEIEGPAAG